MKFLNYTQFFSLLSDKNLKLRSGAINYLIIKSCIFDFQK